MRYPWQPTDLQEKLLEACLSSGECAATALRIWQQSIDLENLDAGSYRLLPLLSAVAEVSRIDPTIRTLILGVYRRTWYHNQLLLAEARALARRLNVAGVPVMVLKGAALSLRYYRDPGVRPMKDLDLAVPVQHAKRAVTVLLEAGWTPEPTPLTGTMTPTDGEGSGWKPGPRAPADFTPWYFGVRHAHGFKGRGGVGVDLHWHIFQGDCDASSDTGSWEAAALIAGEVAPLLSLAEHEELLLVLAHAARWNPVPSVRWVADATMLLRASPDLDWEAFLALAIRRQLTLPAADLLGYLDGRFGVRIPPEVKTGLLRHPVPAKRQRAHRSAVGRPTLLAGLGEYNYLKERHRVLRRELPGDCPRSFLKFVCGILGASRLSQLVDYATRETWRRLRSRC